MANVEKTADRMLDSWYAGFTRRWSTSVHMCDATDHVHGHQARVAILAVCLHAHLHPYRDPTTAFVVAALTHDLGEMRAGADMSAPAKAGDPVLAGLIEAREQGELERLGFYRFGRDLSERQTAILKLADGLDAYLTMLRHKPHLRHNVEWTADLRALEKRGAELGIEDLVDCVVENATVDLT